MGMGAATMLLTEEEEEEDAFTLTVIVHGSVASKKYPASCTLRTPKATHVVTRRGKMKNKRPEHFKRVDTLIGALFLGAHRTR
jgi:hypothetical protein